MGHNLQKSKKNVRKEIEPENFPILPLFQNLSKSQLIFKSLSKSKLSYIAQSKSVHRFEENCAIT